VLQRVQVLCQNDLTATTGETKEVPSGLLNGARLMFSFSTARCNAVTRLGR